MSGRRLTYLGLGLLLALALTLVMYAIDGFTPQPLLAWLALVVIDVVPPMVRRSRDYLDEVNTDPPGGGNGPTAAG